uniref:Uncharacterized protein n=1 Tax=Rhizophora mucronata TaxID=61149 RepID=A0A2P2IQB0_RHIMU
MGFLWMKILSFSHAMHDGRFLSLIGWRNGVALVFLGITRFICVCPILKFVKVMVF